MVAKKPRVIIIGAGMAGLSAAWQLIRAEVSMFDLKVLEASNRIGGRIHTSEIGDNRVELGATWIHGMDGSPLYKIAQEIGAMESTMPFERQDGFPGEPTVKAEGGLTVPTCIVSPIMALYQQLLERIRSNEKLDSTHTPLSIGAFVAQGLDTFLSQQSNTSHLEDLLFDCLSNDGLLSWSNYTSPWTLRSLQEALIAMNEYMERIDTSANTLFDLDLQAEKEYTDYPGEHVTIPGGYMSIINELAASLPATLIHFGKKVEQIVWNRAQQSPVAIYCGDGSVYEADHVIVTVSLGVLKAGLMQESTCPWASPEGKLVCRSVDSLQAGMLGKESSKIASFFEPPLPACKVKAICRLGYGLVNKLFLQLNTSVLSSSQLQQLNSHIQLVYKNSKEVGDTSIPHWMRKTFSLSPIYNGSSVLLCWFAGSEALEIESLSDEEIMSGVARTLASFGVATQSSGMKQHHRKLRDSESSSGSDSEDSLLRGETQSSSSSSSSDSEENFDEDEGSLFTSEGDFRNMFCGVLRSKWGRDPLFHGSYSFVATGASGDDIENLAEPLPQLDGNMDAFNANDAANYGAFNANEHVNASHQASVKAFNARDGAFNTSHQASVKAFNARDGAFNANGHTSHEKSGAADDTSRRTDRSGLICEPAKDGTSMNKEVGGTAPLQLLFAGEATVRALYSTTHGAHLSGLREANRLLYHYGLSVVAPS